MILSFENIKNLSLMVVGIVALGFSASSQADIIDVDRSAVDPQYAEAFKNAEAFWESRIRNYSTELPRAILVQTTSLRIVASTPPIDGPGMILGQAGPTSTLSYQFGGLFPGRAGLRTIRVIPATAQMQFDIDDLPGLAADGTLQDVIVHEMGHALGFGSLWEQNNLIGPLGGIGLMQYIGGDYAIREYGREIGSPVVSFIPIEQRGGGGTALSHWFLGEPFFRQVATEGGPAIAQELMTGFINDAVGPDPFVIADKFVSEATWGAMADLGYEVEGINENKTDPPRGRGTGRWPKVLGSGFDPFTDNGIPPADGLKFNLVNINVVTRRDLTNSGGANSGVGSTRSDDPYRLRQQRWVK